MIVEKIKINNIDDIKQFQKEILNFESDIDIEKDRYIINAKSTMGIFTLDLSTSIDVVLHTDDELEQNKFRAIMRQFQE